MGRRTWGDLSARNRRFLVVAGAVEASLKLAALVDIARRDPREIRGSKKVWVPLIVLVNAFGGAPLAYFRFGVRH